MAESNNLTKLADEMADHLDIPKARSREALQKLFGQILKSAEKGVPVTIRGFGSFHYLERAPRKGRNPRTGESVEVPPARALVFRAAKMTRKPVKRGKAKRG
jgi:DNA-binding protein HU-beta